MERLKILITGGTGFVGANLVRFFLANGHEVATTVRKESNKWRISDILRDTNLFTIDLTDQQKVNDLYTSYKPDVIINTVAYGGYHFETDMKRMINVNFNATVNLVEAYLKSDSQLLINTGSSSEYGFKQKPMSENDVLEPFGIYAVSKAAATLYCRSRSIETHKKIVTFRLFSAYGDYEESHRLIPYLMMSFLKNQKAELNNPNNIRDYIYVKDINNAYNEMIRKTDFIDFGEILNLGSGLETKVSDIVDLVEKISQRKIKINWQYNIERIGDRVTNWVSNMSKTHKTLNWKPRYSLEEGLSETYKWFEKNANKYEVTENSKFKRVSEGNTY